MKVSSVRELGSVCDREELALQVIGVQTIRRSFATIERIVCLLFGLLGCVTHVVNLLADAVTQYDQPGLCSLCAKVQLVHEVGIDVCPLANRGEEPGLDHLVAAAHGRAMRLDAPAGELEHTGDAGLTHEHRDEGVLDRYIELALRYGIAVTDVLTTSSFRPHLPKCSGGVDARSCIPGSSVFPRRLWST